ncbi:T-protein [Fusobacterium polymorphum]|uniref:Shikimate dehydrogenase n=1 Tax=Fusobacterium polymorphum ATCC 10953 TaxID=393480 RepID=A5TSI3_FUSNP|nr:chorismate mutase [Fusobacterium polymorphum]EDK87858.1 shikimate dehydrogenase [Fusobacterium polymorphum ATCC 10953]UTI53044.1 chorismate mutase [Fusobacterium polymorphum]WRL67557.1 chorismate mutase [Fusobacterium polymorphum]CKH19972.1 T-protein [Fusobacterium polymorphum]
MIELELMRKKIDEIDNKLLALFKERLEVSKKIGLLKKKYKMEIFDPQREQEIIDGCTQNISEDEKVYVEKFLRNLMDISKEVQSK